jgi:predicted ATPase/class 3 adenylate cyclase
MTFDEVLDQVRELLQRRGRLSYQALKLRFNIDDSFLEGVKGELIKAERIAADEGGEVLVWVGASPVPSSEFRVPSSTQPPTPNPQPPSSYTPPHLAERIRAEQAAMEARSSTDGERKTITALFADLKGSTALIEGLDPEDARAIIDPALQLMMDAVHRYDGYVAQALGDGIFALFGAPIAHEDHPQRALYAALRMQEEMRRYADTLRAKGSPPLLMRVGLNTGEVVVRSIRKDDLHADYVPVGHSTNLAARMEQLAAPGSILVTDYTYKLTDGYFGFKDLGRTQIKGVEEPLHIYEVLGAGPLRTRLQVSTRRGLTRFVGRQNELEQMRRALEQAKAGHGQIVGVMGEPGLGKSRLFYEFKLLSPKDCLILEAYSVSYGKASPYLPVIELLKSYFDITVEDDERKRREKIGGKVLMLDRSLEDTLPYLFAMLGVEEQPSPLQQMDAQIRRRRTFEALKKLFVRESLNQPLIFIFEDLHWVDGETQGFLDVLSESVASAKVLLLVNYRPEYRHEWGSKTYYTQLRLAPFGKDEAEEFLTALLGDRSSPQPSPQRREGEFPLPVGERARVRGMENNLQTLKQLILEKTEGTPFFMEEVIQELYEQGVLVRDARVGWVTTHPTTTALHVPTTVQGVLASRIDRLAPDEKALVQQLAVIGREFPLSLVRHVVSQSEEELDRLLSLLQHKEFLYEQPAFPEVEYIFKHALTQEVAYNSVLQERRKALHGKTAQTMEALYSANLEEHYSELAHHYSRSGNTEKAVHYLHLAGQQAVQRSANADAVGYLTAALELLKILPDTPGRAQQELTVQTTLGPVFMNTKGYAAPEVGSTYARARELCQQVGDTLQTFQVLRGLWYFCLMRSDLQTAGELGKHLLALAQQLGDSDLLLEAHWALGSTAVHLGELVSARDSLEQVITLYKPQQHRSHAQLYGEESGVIAQAYIGRPLWLLGYPDQALQRSPGAVHFTQELQHPFSLAFTLAFVAITRQFRQEPSATQEWAETLIALSTEQGFPAFEGLGRFLQGWALASQGHSEEGIAQMRQGHDAFQATGAELDRPWLLVLLAEAYGNAGQVKEGLRLLVEASTVVDKEDRYWEAELYRLRGELTLAQSKVQSLKPVLSVVEGSQDPDPQFLNPDLQGEAEACFRKAIDTAQRQQAKSLELRATVSLARLWQQQSKIAEAHEMLSQIYNWFTEGFDTKDLQEANALLENLH